MKVAKCYPEKGMDCKSIVQKAKNLGLDGLAVSAISGSCAHFKTEKMRHSGFALRELRDAVLAEGLQFGLIFPFFHDEHVWNKSPERRASLPEKDLAWYRPLCPVYPGLFEERLSLFLEATCEIKPDFVGLDFFRFPLFWEGIGESMEVKTCSCESCSADGRRSEVIREYAEVIMEKIEGLRACVHLVPFTIGEVQEATGQDPQALAGAGLVLSPMLYHKLLKREESFVGEALKLLESFQVWPSVELGSAFFEDTSGTLQGYEKVIYFYFDLKK